MSAESISSELDDKLLREKGIGFCLNYQRPTIELAKFESEIIQDKLLDSLSDDLKVNMTIQLELLMPFDAGFDK